ncbi:hypothetical protein KKC52_03690, partial [bacterium]|nr:hypothetical protein [bacterium]
PLIGDLSVYVGLEEGSYEVGPSGRVIENGPLTLVIPPGAVSSWITVKVKPVASEAIVGFNPIGPVFDIQPSGMIFNKPVTLILEYKESQLNVDVAEKDLAIFYDDGFDWLPIPSTVDELNNTVSASLSHFSRYALGVINHRHAASSLLEGVILTHNPVKPKGAGWVATEFEFATTAKSGSATLNIFDALGEKVKTITKDLTGASAEDPVVIPWDGADDDGHLVNNGIYIFSLKVGSEVKTGVVGVVK